MAETAASPDFPCASTAQRLAAFASWLATRVDHDSCRRYRAVARDYLQFVADDHGATGTRGCRFVVAYRSIEPPRTTRAALELLAEFEAEARHGRAARRAKGFRRTR